jgi:hypothetical protein
MTPPAIAGAFDFREDVDGVGDVECGDGVEEAVMEGGAVEVKVGDATINSGL